MNAYLVMANDVRVLQEYIGGYPRYEIENLADIVFAETRGQAKATFAYRYRHDIEFIDVSSCLFFADGVDRPRGVAASNDPIWQSAQEELQRLVLLI